MPKYDNSERLSTVSDKDWCEALDELSTYLRWRLRGKTRWGAHSEKELETPALVAFQLVCPDRTLQFKEQTKLSFFYLSSSKGGAPSSSISKVKSIGFRPLCERAGRCICQWQESGAY